MELSKLVYAGEAIKIIGDCNIEITQITTDILSCAAGTLLIATNGNVLLHNPDLLSNFSAIML